MDNSNRSNSEFIRKKRKIVSDDTNQSSEYYTDSICGWCLEKLHDSCAEEVRRTLPPISLINGIVTGHFDCVYSQLFEALPNASITEGVSVLLRKRLGRAPRLVERKYKQGNSELKVLLSWENREIDPFPSRHAIIDEEDSGDDGDSGDFFSEEGRSDMQV